MAVLRAAVAPALVLAASMLVLTYHVRATPPPSLQQPRPPPLLRAIAGVVTIDLVATYGNVSAQSFRLGVAAAQAHFSSTSGADDTVELLVRAGRYVVHEAEPLIDLSGTKPGPNGRLVIRGEGMDSTTIVTDGFGSNFTIQGRGVWRTTIAGIHFTRGNYTVSQGIVVSTSPAQVVLDIAPGFPSPADIFDASDPTGRWLKRYTSSATDPHVVVDPSNNGTVWPPTINKQCGWTEASQTDPSAHPSRWAFTLLPQTPAEGYSPGDTVGIKSKHDGQAFWLGGGGNITFDGVKWTQRSRGVLRMGISDIDIRNCVVERSPAIEGQVPCLAGPGGGWQLGQPNDPTIYNVRVDNYTAIGTGDDSVAFFNVGSGSVTNSHIRDSLARGVLLFNSPNVVVGDDNVIVRCPVWHTDHLSEDASGWSDIAINAAKGNTPELVDADSAAGMPAAKSWLPEVVSLPACSDATGDSKGVQLWYADSLHKLFPGDATTRVPAAPSTEAFVRAGRGEHAMLQLAVVAPNTTTSTGGAAGRSYSLKFDNLTYAGPTASGSSGGSDGGGAMIDAASIAVFDVNYVPVSQPVNVANRTGPFPDPLPIATAPWAPPAGAAQLHAWWIKVPVPRTDSTDGSPFAAGAYSGSVSLVATDADGSDAEAVCVAQLTVDVWDLDVPVAGNASQRTGAAFSGAFKHVPENNGTVDAWYADATDHRLNRYVWQIALPEILAIVTRSGDQWSVALNTTAYDARVATMLASGVGGLRFPSPKGATVMLNGHGNMTHYIAPATVFSFSTNVSVPMFVQPAAGAPVSVEFTQDFLDLFRVVYGAIVAHLDSRGWMQHMFAQFVDEPTYSDEFTLRAMLAVGKLFKSLHPALRWSQTRFPVPAIPDLLPLVDAWIAHVEQWLTPGVPAQLAAQRALGKEIFMYNNGIPIIDLPAHRLRLFPWAVWRTNWDNATSSPADGLQGTLSWYSLTSWLHDPYDDPHGYCPGRKPPCPAGWGYLLYPSVWKPTSPDEVVPPVTSVRWELFLKGLEDAEYFAALAALHERACRGVQVAEGRDIRRLGVDGSDAAGPSHEVSAEVVGTRGDAAMVAACDAGASALNGVSRAVWGFTEVTQYTDTVTYTTNTTLVHAVQDAVAAALVALRQAARAG